MKRLPSHKRPEYGIKKIFPVLTSYECEICGYECRFMRMWDIIIGFWRGIPVHKLICYKCMPNKADVIIWANKARSDTKTKYDKWKLKPPQGGSGVPNKQKLPELEVNIPMPKDVKSMRKD